MLLTRTYLDDDTRPPHVQQRLEYQEAGVCSSGVREIAMCERREKHADPIKSNSP